KILRAISSASPEPSPSQALDSAAVGVSGPRVLFPERPFCVEDVSCLAWAAHGSLDASFPGSGPHPPRLIWSGAARTLPPCGGKRQFQLLSRGASLGRI